MKPTIRNRARDRLDKKLEALGPLDRFAVPPKGWIRAIRDAIGMTGAQLGKRVGTSPQGILGLPPIITVSTCVVIPASPIESG